MNTIIIRMTLVAALLITFSPAIEAQAVPNDLSADQIQQILTIEGLDNAKAAELLGNMSGKTLAEQVNLIMDTDGLTPQQRTAVLTAITTGYAPVPTQNTGAGSPNDSDGKKNLVDVLDKALNLTSGMVSRVSGKMEEYAPKVWHIMKKQQYANAIADVILPLILVLVAVGFVLYSSKIPNSAVKRWRNMSSYEDGDVIFFWIIARLVPILCVIVFSICLVTEIALSTKLLINPEFYAIQDLMKIFLTKGGSI